MNSNNSLCFAEPQQPSCQGGASYRNAIPCLTSKYTDKYSYLEYGCPTYTDNQTQLANKHTGYSFPSHNYQPEYPNSNLPYSSEDSYYGYRPVSDAQIAGSAYGSPRSFSTGAPSLTQHSPSPDRCQLLDIDGNPLLSKKQIDSQTNERNEGTFRD